MERRSSEHYKSGHECKGKIILAETLTIRDISLSGIQLETREYLTPNSICRIEITSSYKDKITPLCEVVWSNLLRTEKKKKETLSIYGVGLKFIELNDSEKQFLEKNRSELASG